MTELPLTGPSAGTWDAVGSYLSLTSLALLIVTSLLANATGWPIIINVILAPLCVAGIFAGVALRFLGLGKFRAEARAGYSTLQDLRGFDLRDATTGHIIRPASEPVADWSKVTWFRTARRFDRYKLSR